MELTKEELDAVLNALEFMVTELDADVESGLYEGYDLPEIQATRATAIALQARIASTIYGAPDDLA